MAGKERDALCEGSRRGVSRTRLGARRVKGDFTTEVLCEEGLSIYANCSTWLTEASTKQGRRSFFL